MSKILCPFTQNVNPKLESKRLRFCLFKIYTDEFDLLKRLNTVELGIQSIMLVDME